jgi:hypothetical protein
MIISDYRKISIIHGIKCAKTLSDEVAIESFNTATSLKGRLNEDSFNQSEIDDWQKSNPIVSDREIEQLIAQKNGE